MPETKENSGPVSASVGQPLSAPAYVGDIAAVIDSSEPQREIFAAIHAGGTAASIAFNESMTLRFDGKLDAAAFCAALEQLILRYDSLRATFNRYGTQFCIHRQLGPDFRYRDASASAAQTADAVLAEEQRRAVSEPFDLMRGPLFRSVLLKLDERHFAAILTAHHIVCDGWSIAVMLEDLAELYSAQVEQRPALLAEPVFYLQYLQRMRSDEYRAQAAADEKFWLEQYRDAQPVLDLPADFSRPPIRTYAASRCDHLLAQELVAATKKTGAANKSSFVATLLTAFAVLLHRLSGQRDIVVGMPAAGQSIETMERLVGHCVNTLPIHCSIDPNLSFAQNLQAQRDRLFATYDHQRLTFGSLVAKLGMRRDPSRIPLVPILYNIDQGIAALRFSGVQTHVESNPRIAESFEIFLNATERDGAVLLECQYNTDLYSAETIARWLALFETLLQQIVRDPALPVGAYRMTSERDAALWRRINATACEFPRKAGVHDLLGAACIKHGDARVYFGGESCTHAELDRRAGQLAAYLQRQNVKIGDFVGICMPRSLDMLVAMLGVLKAGAAYVPLDPEYPAERLQLMIDDSGLTTLLWRDEIPAGLDTEALKLVDMRAIPAEGETYSAAINPDSPAYAIYTSGSTGRPKGVVVPHRSVVSFLCTMAQEPGLNAQDHLLAVTTISFDIAVLELFLPLFVGAHLTIASREDTKDGFKLLARMHEQNITVMQATPSTWRLLLAAGWNGSAAGRQGAKSFKVLTGGEALPQTLADELCAIVGEVWNMYGPTETTVWSMVARIRKGEPVTLGKPIGNTCLKIVDVNSNADVAIGVPGELLIGGDGVTLGYWRRPELNNERFLTSDGVRYYRTGDLVRLTASGALLYLGRLDNQIKLRGYRIELGEIETRLANLPGVAETAVVVQEFGEGDQRLMAFYRARLGAQLSAAALRDHLAAVLPSFMVPQQFVELERFPLTPNGKVDRKTLGSLHAAAPTEVSAGAGDEHADAVILAAFRRFLQQPQLHANADFFQHGGHSLLAMRMLADINKQHGSQLALNDLFQAPTAAALSALFARAALPASTEQTQTSIPRQADRTKFRMSLQQRRLWYLEQLEQTGIEYNLPASWRFRGEFDANALAVAVDLLWARHAVLRTNLIETGDGLFQCVNPARTGVLKVISVDGDSERQRLETVTAILNERKSYRFNLAEDELFQIELYRLGPDDHVVFALIHHAIFDGWSFDIMLAELAEVYNATRARRAPALAELPVQYGDFSEWMRLRAEAGDERDLNFWLEHLRGELPVLDLPCERSRPECQLHRGAGLEFAIDAATMQRVTEFARQQGTTLYMVMMAAYKTLLWRYSGQRDIIVGTPISGRNYAEINDLIGFFVNILALRDRIDPSAPFTQLLAQVKRTCLAAFTHQDTPFEQVVERLNPPRDSSRSAIFQVMLMYQDISNRTEVFEGLTRRQVNVDRPGVQTDLDFWLKWDGQVMAGGFEYDRDVLSKATIEAMCADYIGLVARIPNCAEQPLSQLADLPNSALQQCLQQLNATAMPLPEPALVHCLFEAQARRTPAAVATRYRNKRLTYAELDARANRIAHWLDHIGVQPGALIGVALSPSDWLQAVLLGVLKHGSTYVPIDPQFPLERIRYMIDNSALAHLLHDEALDARVIELSKVPTTKLQELIASLPGSTAAIAPRPISSDAPAYVIYTSGSTGQPKGVVVKQRGVVNYLLSMARTPGFTERDCILAATTLSFDIAVTELLLPLITGGSSVLIDRDIATDGDLLREVIETAGITVYQATPSSWRVLLASGWSGERGFKALCGGEALPADLIEPLLTKVGELWNVYGPTETTVWSTCHRVMSGDEVGIIGQPLANTACYILNEQRQVVPLGVIGELYIGGEGVAAGYLNRPDLTAERFVDNPFGAGKLYRTGDMAQLLATGSIRYHGRSDHQVKVRGYRIELGEIEAALAQHAGVTQAVVVARAFEADDLRLVAYVVGKKGEPLDVAELRAFLRDYLPSYMLPQHIVALDAMPMTPNLKIDRNALPAPTLVAATNVRLPATENEKRLAAIWCEVLKIDRVTLEENFFDCGGHSLTATDAIRRIYQQTAHRFEVREFIMETLEQLAAKLDAPPRTMARETEPAGPRRFGRFLQRFTGKSGL